jgi:glucose-1-phosphate thymidylyltransferase
VKGLVLAGGAGTRLRPLTHTGAKQLVPVANKPILFYVIESLVEAGITDIVVVLSMETGAEVRAALGDGSRWNAQLTYVVQDRPAGLAHAVLTARAALGDADFCMFLGDNLIGSKIRAAVERFSAQPALAASVMLKEVSNPSSFGVAEVDDHGNVIALVEKPKAPRTNLALVGVYLFRPTIYDAIAHIEPSARGELEITDAISRLIVDGARVHFERVTTWWLDTGKKDDLLLANETVLEHWLEHAVNGDVDADSRLIGRVHIGEGATVVRSTIQGPSVIGKGARLVDARIGPFTSLGERVKVERAGVERSVLMDDSEVRDIDRLEDSLVGRRVVISPGTRRPGGTSLLVGDDCVIELASGKE